MAVKSDKDLMDDWFETVDYDPTNDLDLEPDDGDDDDEAL